MRQRLTLLLAAILVAKALPCKAQTPSPPGRKPAAIHTDQVPTIPERIAARLDRYQNVKSASFADWRPSEGILYASRIGNVSQLYSLEKPGGSPSQITTGDDPVTSGRCLPDGSTVFSRSSGGDENFQIYKLAAGAKNPTLLTDGKSRNLAGPIDRKGRRLAFTSTRRNGRDADLYAIDLETGGPADLILQVENETWTLDEWAEDGSLAIVTRFVSANETHPHLFNTRTRVKTPLPGETSTASKDKVRRDNFCFGPRSQSLYLTTDARGEFRELARLDLLSSQYSWLTEGLPHDVEEVKISDDATQAAFTINSQGYSRLFLLDLLRLEAASRPQDARTEIPLPQGIVTGLRFRRANELGFAWESTSSPMECYSLRLPATSLKRWTESERAAFTEADFVQPELIHYPTFDGRQVPAFVYRPRGQDRAPVIVSIHGGPEAQSRPSFSARYQAWIAELGAAVIVPNVRGSTGYGKTYSRLDNGSLRENSVRDIGHLLDWIAKDDRLDPSRVAVAGGSYGGYMVLASLVHFPSRIKAGVDMVGISNFRTFLENTSAYRRDLRRAEYGDERDPKMRAFLEQISPASRIHELRSALFLVHGENDPRVPISEARQIVQRARTSGQPVWTLYASNEGHGFTRRENSDYLDTVTVLFLERHLLDRTAAVRPSGTQVDWQDLELGVSCHLGINTFHDRPSSEGKLEPQAFSPTLINAEAWVRAAKESGAGYFILTAKDAEGFCLWPTATTGYSVRSSPWRDGKGNLVQEVADACKLEGLKFGVCLSVKDRHELSHPGGKLEHPLYLRQLEELLTGHGPLVEIQLDGVGSEWQEYDKSASILLVRKHQPDARCVQRGVPTIPGSGNDREFAPQPCRNLVRGDYVSNLAPGMITSDGPEELWLPLECEVPLRDRGPWHPDNEKTLKSLEELMALYYRSIGRGANLLLSVAPDPRGLWPDADSARLKELGDEIRRRFDTPVAQSGGSGDEIVLDLGGVKSVDHVISREEPRDGERVRKYVLEARVEGNWLPIVRGTRIGQKKIDIFPATVAADQIRLRTLERSREPRLRSIAAFAVGEVTRDRAVPSNLLAESRSAAMARDPSRALELVDRAVNLTPAWPPAHLLRARLRSARGDAAGAVRDLDLAITLLAPDGSLHHQRGFEHFTLGQFRESTADFERSVEVGGKTHSSDECWERGLARYYAGDFEGARQQFEGYHRVGPLDIENGLWWMLCVAENDGLDRGRAALPGYTTRQRPPFPALLDLYLGQGSAEAVIAQAESNPEAESKEKKDESLFYAHLYLGLYLKISDRRVEARKHFEKALEHPVDHFMYWCAQAELR